MISEPPNGVWGTDPEAKVFRTIVQPKTSLKWQYQRQLASVCFA